MRSWFNLEACRAGSRRVKGMFSPAMSARMYFLDFYVYPPLVALCLFAAFWGVAAARLPALLGLVLSGYAAWTLVEYLVHRYILHRVTGFRALHEAHHDSPNELIGSPTIISLAIFYGAAYLPLTTIFGLRSATAFLAGLIAGYLAYLFTHYAVHHLGSGGYRFMRKLIRRHAAHHHLSPACNFGVTTGFWDKVFGTDAG